MSEFVSRTPFAAALLFPIARTAVLINKPPDSGARSSRHPLHQGEAATSRTGARQLVTVIAVSVA